jgi:hypothetical protein
MPRPRRRSPRDPSTRVNSPVSGSHVTTYGTQAARVSEKHRVEQVRVVFPLGDLLHLLEGNVHAPQQDVDVGQVQRRDPLADYGFVGASPRERRARNRTRSRAMSLKDSRKCSSLSPPHRP